MKIEKLVVVTSSLLFTGLALAGHATAVTFPLDGITVSHQSRDVISLRMLDKGYWNIDCQYKVIGRVPNSGNPLAVSIRGSNYGSEDEVMISGSGYTPNGLTASSGTLKINHVWKGMAGSVTFDNYDSTADLVVYNCAAWKF